MYFGFYIIFKYSLVTQFLVETSNLLENRLGKKHIHFPGTGIYPSSFTNVRFCKKIEFSNVAFREKWSKLPYNEGGGLQAL